jgi:hypothetical protein
MIWLVVDVLLSQEAFLVQVRHVSLEGWYQLDLTTSATIDHSLRRHKPAVEGMTLNTH